MHNRQLFPFLVGLVVFVIPTIAWSQTQTQQSTENVGVQTLYGVLKAPGRHFRFVVKLKQQDGELSGILKSLDEGGAEFKLSELVCDDSRFEFALKNTGATYRGTLEDGNGDPESVYQGNWTQRGQDFPLKFSRVAGKTPDEEVSSIWQGKLETLFQELNMQFRELESGQIYFDSPTQRMGGFVVEIDSKDGKIVWKVPALAGVFEGKLNETNTEIVGQWKQNGSTSELVLEKVNHPAKPTAVTPPKRPQNPRPPFPYDIREVTFAGGDQAVRLAGTLTIPKSANKVPAVVLVSGSGPQNRDEEILDHKPFWIIADHFSRQGIAVLRYDDRGTAKSTGDFGSATTADLANDAEAAFDFLRGQDGIDTSRMGICGHSEGGMIAPIVAARNENVSYIVLMAGTGVNGAEILKNQSQLILEAMGTSEQDLEINAQVQSELIKLALKQPLEKEAFVQQASELVQKLMPSNSEDESKSVVERAWIQLSSPWCQYFMMYEPAESLRQLKCSVLALNGEKDLQVDPDLNLPAIEAALEKSKTTDYEIVRFPNMNHLFQTCESGLMKEYSTIEQTIDPRVLKKMSTWILAR